MKLIKRSLALALVVLLLINIIPSPISLAASDESVLTSLGHKDTNTAKLSGNERSLSLYVPFNYEGDTIDLRFGLDISYDVTLYKSVISVVSNDSVKIGEETIITISYNKISEADDAPQSKTEYKVRVLRREGSQATFSGIISKQVNASEILALTSSDFTGRYNKNDGLSLGSIKINGANLLSGDVFYSGSKYDLGTKINVDDLSKLSFVPKSPITPGIVSYDVTAYDTADKYVGSAVLTIIVYTNPNILDSFSDVVYRGSIYSFTAKQFEILCDLHDMPLTKIEISPDATSSGTWYYNSTPITGTQEITAANISKLSFQATTKGTATFSWRAENAAGYSESKTGKLTINIPNISLKTFTSSTTTPKGSTWWVEPSHFTYTPAAATLTYIKINTIPAAADGTLVLTTALAKDTVKGYPAIAANSTLKAGAIIPIGYVEYLKLVTKTTSPNANISFTWSAITADTIIDAAWSDPASYIVRFVTGGAVEYQTDVNVPVTFSATDFSIQYKKAMGENLAYVTFTLPSKTSGTLFYDYDQVAKKGTSVTASTKYYPDTKPNLSYITFVPATDFAGTVTISYNAYKTDGTFVAGRADIIVKKSAAGTVNYTIDKNSNVQVDAAHFAKAFLDSTGKNLSYVKFTLPSTSLGKLYYDYKSPYNYESSVSASKKYFVYSSSYLSYVSFVPASDFIGTATIHYTAYDDSGNGYAGKLIVSVLDNPAGIVQYNTKVNGIVNLKASDFSDEFISVTGSVLSYVQFTPPAATAGSLYYQYTPETGKGTKIAASTKYYNGATPTISDISFVPAKDFVGNVDIKYTVYTASGASYVGKLKVQVGETSSGSVSFSTNLNTPVVLKASDFSSMFFSNTGGSILSYVTFNLPSSSYGKLYYDYTSPYNYGSVVTEGTKYNIKSAPYLSNVAFVPKSDFSGTFSFTYTGYSADGTGYTGKINITVNSAAGTVTYKTTPATPVKFSSSDFVDAFEEVSGTSLSYVKFSLPSSSQGNLYYGYTSSKDYSSAVSYTTKYYVNSWPSISNISFVPNSNFTGSFNLNYTAYDTNDTAYQGTIVLTVKSTSGGSVYYESKMKKPVTLDADDFNSTFMEESGSSLYYVTFTLPSANQGQLYYGYVSDSQYSSKVSSTTKYYRSSSPLLSNVTFVPHKNFTGTVNIKYTGYTVSGKSYSGVLTITVSHPFTDVELKYPWASKAISGLYHHGIITGTGDGRFNPGASMSRGDFMLMVYRAFNLTAPSSGNFPDVPSGSYYFDAIAAAKALGIALGSNGKFNPSSSISREDAMVILSRTLEILGKPLSAGTQSDLSQFNDAKSISSYAVDAVTALVKSGLVTGSSGNIHPKSMISRAEMAVLLDRIIENL